MKDQVELGKRAGFLRNMCRHLCRSEYGMSYKAIWKAKIPLKIKNFMWLAMQDAILTKDNRSLCHWQGHEACAFCTEKKT